VLNLCDCYVLIAFPFCFNLNHRKH